MDKVKTESKKELPTAVIVAGQSACNHTTIFGSKRYLNAYKEDGEYVIHCSICGETASENILRKIQNIARTDSAMNEAAAIKLADCDFELDTELRTLISLLNELLLEFPKTEKVDIDFDVENMTKSDLIEYFVTMIFGVKLLASKCNCIERHIDFLSKLEMKLRLI